MKTITLKNNIKITIRPEQKEEFPAIYQLIKTAFETAKVKDGDEQDFTDRLRNSADYIPEMGFVAEYEGQLIGQILFTKTYVTQSDGSLYTGLLVAPLSVLLEYRNQGVGSALMQEGFNQARKRKYKAAFLCGDPAYYYRFGFRQTLDFNIKMKKDIPPQYVLACELEPGSLSQVNGVVDFC